MIYAVVGGMAVLGGIVQTVTGFGAGVIMMLALPYFFSMIHAPALSAAIGMGLTYALAWRFRKYVDFKSILVPCITYVGFSVFTILTVQKLDMALMTLGFGVFQIVLALYSLFFTDRIRFAINWRTGLICGGISGVLSGMFGIGGPLMAIYFTFATDSKETYIGSSQFLFALGGTINLLLRIDQGLYRLDMIPLTLLGIAAITLGKYLGLRILEKLNKDTMRKLVYLFVGVSGLITVVKSFL